VTLDPTYAARAVPPGSDRFWSWHFASPASRDALLAVFALMAEWDALLAPGREPTVSLAKLVWWHEELERFAAGAPLHAITRFMAQLEPADDQRSTLLREAFEALQLHSERQAAPLLLLVCRAAVPGDATETPALREFCDNLATELHTSSQAGATPAQLESSRARLQALPQRLPATLRGALRGLIVLASLRAHPSPTTRRHRAISVWRAWRAARAAMKGTT
jgi:hypothetical protein